MSLRMSAADALDMLTARLDRVEDSLSSRMRHIEDEKDELDKEHAAVVTELKLMRKSVDRFTNALLVGSVSIITTSVSILLFFKV